ncbi:aldo/keto reductase [Membranihabitans maritimus]|uniref:aldo/keto reductase n=1 Tax=Membranihabitans maritimus TaxID=2904244 RepID=UPI001F25341D|nr:aldo/keto reductase [Membranihabitans maritimus]
MNYKYISNTGLLVSELCLGTMTFGGKNGGIWEKIGNVEQKEANSLIKTAFDAGINFIDTANVYSFGESEQLLGQALKDLGIPRDEVIIATKVLGKMNEKPNSAGLSRYHIFNSVDASLKRLQLEHIDILYVHGVDPKTPIEEIMHSLNDIVNTGKVRYIAVCNWYAWQISKAQAIAQYKGWHKFIALQHHYAAVNRDIEHELVPMAVEHNLSIFPWSPLAGGFLTGKFTRKNTTQGARRSNFDFPPVDKEKAYNLVDILQEMGNRYDASIAQLALAWVRQQRGITSTIIGAKTVDQLNENIKSVTIDLSDNDLKEIDEISPLPLQYPGWMVRQQSGYRM